MKPDTQSPPVEIQLKDYKAYPFAINSVEMVFDLQQAFADVTTKLDIKRLDAQQDYIYLDGGPYMELREVRFNETVLKPSDYTLTDDGLTVPFGTDKGRLTIVTRLKPAENKRLEGLYLSGGNYCTQCEAEGFRHITYYPDRPDVLSVFSVRVEADQQTCPVLLSNGNPGEAGVLADGRHFAEWHDPHPKPAYLFALVAGALERVSDRYVTAEGRPVDLHIYVRKEDIDKCDYAMQSLIRSMKWDEQEFGLCYDLDVYNIVAVSDFNMGAMENKGLNVFNTKYVLASKETATDQDFDHVEGVIGHEYFHNWTGNRVTCRDWFQLSLKEGLTVFRDQEFSADMTSRAIKRIDDVRVLRAAQFPEDAGPLAHPVRPEKYIEINNFYTATVYNKGAEVIRMIHTLIGKDAFRKGMDIYFERFDGQAVTCEDFVQAMEAGSGADLTQFRFWYEQAGTPQVTVKRSYDSETRQLTLTIEQSVPDTPGQQDKKAMLLPISIGFVGQSRPVNVISGNVETRGDDHLLLVTKDVEDFVFGDVERAAVPSLLRGFSAPVQLSHDLSDQELALLASADTDAFVRSESVQTLSRKEIIAAVSNDSHDLVTFSPDIVGLFTGMLTDIEKQDMALTAELLSIPSEGAIIEHMTNVDPERVFRARKGLVCAVAKALEPKLAAAYHKVASVNGLSQEAKAARRLKMILLDLMAAAECVEIEELVRSQFLESDTMTDRFGALRVAVFHGLSVADELLQAFYARHQDDDLVIDKWFMVQAASPADGVLDVVMDLTNHKAFNLENPNRMRSLIAVFAFNNIRHFHDKSGRAYSFLAEKIVALDKMNPQVAARSLAPLCSWKKYEVERQQLMRDALKSILNAPSLSPDVFEIASKGLAD